MYTYSVTHQCHVVTLWDIPFACQSLTHEDVWAMPLFLLSALPPQQYTSQQPHNTASAQNTPVLASTGYGTVTSADSCIKSPYIHTSPREQPQYYHKFETESQWTSFEIAKLCTITHTRPLERTYRSSLRDRSLPRYSTSSPITSGINAGDPLPSKYLPALLWGAGHR